jgi:hypothetical protein
MARVLADGKLKFTVVTTAPANPAAPTATELNAGIDLSCDILASDFTWSATASDTIDEKALCATGNSVVFGASNYDTGITLWRQFDPSTGAPDTANEAGWEALKNKGTTVWAYARESGKDSTEDWAAGDEIYLGGEVVTDEAQRTDGTGFVKRRVVLGPQRLHSNIEVASAA